MEINKTTIVLAVAIGLLIVVSGVQAFELASLKEQLSGGLPAIAPKSAPAMSGGNLAANLKNLPSMVGGC